MCDHEEERALQEMFEETPVTGHDDRVHEPMSLGCSRIRPALAGDNLGPEDDAEFNFE